MILHHPSTSHHHVAPGSAWAGEDQSVQQVRGGNTQKACALCIDDQRISARADLQTPTCLAGSSGACEHTREQALRGRRFTGLRRRGDIALAFYEPLSIVEPA